jgi:hypothetical protein
MPARRRAVLPETGRRSVLKGGSHEQSTAGVPQPQRGGVRQICQQEDGRFYQKQVGDPF